MSTSISERRAPSCLILGLVGLSVIAGIGCSGGTEPSDGGSTAVTELLITPASDTVLVRGSLQLTATARNAAHQPVAGVTITWSTSDAALATVTGQGAVTALALGSVVITATGGEKTASATLTLAPAVSLSPRMPSLFAGDTTLLVPTLTDATGAPLSGAVTFTSESEAVATVSSAGVVMGHATGQARITANVSGGIAAVDVVVLSRGVQPNREIAMYRGGTRFDGMGITELWTVQPNGAEFVRVSEAEEYVTQYAWSPDGSRLAVVYVTAGFNSNPPYGRSGLFTMDPDGANQTPVVSGDARSPSWSPTGHQLVYFASVGGSSSATRIVRRNADGSGELPLTAGFFVDVNPAWSPDGQKIAWRRDIQSRGELWVMDASGANQRRLVLPVGVSRFTWSPDSRQLAVDAVQGPAEPVGVWLINSDGSEPRAFTPNCSDTGICTAPSTSAATWAPDGKRVAYLEAGLAGIRVKAREGSSTLTVAVPAACCTGVAALSWSPDGQAIAFKTSTLRSDGLANEGRTAVVPVTGGSPLLVSPPANDVGAPQWRP